MFLPVLRAQASDEQAKKWLPLAENYRYIGWYVMLLLNYDSCLQLYFFPLTIENLKVMRKQSLGMDQLCHVLKPRLLSILIVMSGLSILPLNPLPSFGLEL